MSSVNLQWLGQSGYRIWDEDTEILLDPYLSHSVERVVGRQRLLPIYPAPEQLTPSLIVCTHDHLDHLDPDTLQQIPTKHIPVLAPSSCTDKLQELDYVNHPGFDAGKSVTAGAFTLTSVPAVHSVDAIGVVITHGDLRLYFTGDTLFDNRLDNPCTHNCDILFVCINGRLGNMAVGEAVTLTRMVKPGIAVPNHYGMFASNTADPTDFTRQVTDSKILQPYTVYSVEKQQEVRICSVI